MKATDPSDLGPIFAERLNATLDAHAFPPINAGRLRALASRYGVSRQVAHKWCAGEQVPPLPVILALANDLQTSIDWLLGIETMSTSARIPIYQVKDEEAAPVSSNFALTGHLTLPRKTEFIPSFIVRNWEHAIDPLFLKGDYLALTRGPFRLTEGAVVMIKSSLGASIRRIESEEGGQWKLVRTSLTSTSAITMTDDRVHFSAAFGDDAISATPLVVGRIDGVFRFIRPDNNHGPLAAF